MLLGGLEREKEGWQAYIDGRERELRKVGEYRERNLWEKIMIILLFHPSSPCMLYIFFK